MVSVLGLGVGGDGSMTRGVLGPMTSYQIQYQVFFQIRVSLKRIVEFFSAQELEEDQVVKEESAGMTYLRSWGLWGGPIQGYSFRTRDQNRQCDHGLGFDNGTNIARYLHYGTEREAGSGGGQSGCRKVELDQCHMRRDA